MENNYSFILEEKIGEHTFKLLDPVTMPVERQKAFHREEFAIRKWGISESQLKMFVNEMIKLTSAKPDEDMMKYFSALDQNRLKTYELATRLKDVIDSETKYMPYMKCAATIILLDDEPVYPMSPSHHKKKLELVLDNDEVESFFLRVILSLLRNTKESLTITQQLDLLSSEEMRREHLLNYLLKS